jgi:hypothetical protein
MKLRALTVVVSVLFAAPSVRAQIPLRAERIATELARPVFLTAPLGDPDRLFVLEQHTGRVRILDNGLVLPAPFLDIGHKISKANEQGLLGLAFHPSYQTNGRFFVYYTDTAGDTVIEEYAVSANPNVASAAGTVVLGPYAQPLPAHNGGCLQFSPADGKLYCALGDGGGVGGPFCNAQNGSLLQGKVIRLDVDIAFPHVPSDNPFVGVAGVDDRIWSLGFRHPWRFSFDRATGDMYVGDVGQYLREEIDWEPPGMGGRNYGWKVMEGTTCFGTGACRPGIPTCNSPSLTPPIHEYDNVGPVCAVIGGYVYNGAAMPDLVGTYFYGDHCSSEIWSFEFDGVSVTNLLDRTAELTPSVGTLDNLTAFGEDGLGELYLCDFDGEIYKITPGVYFPYCTAGQSASGCMADLSAAGVASASAATGFGLVATDVEGGKDGLFFFGANGRQSNVWGNGSSFQCIVPPVTRAGILAGTGTNGLCDGLFSQDLNALWCPSCPRPQKNPGAGAIVQTQLWYRDPFNTSNQTTSLSNAIEFWVEP